LLFALTQIAFYKKKVPRPYSDFVGSAYIIQDVFFKEDFGTRLQINKASIFASFLY